MRPNIRDKVRSLMTRQVLNDMAPQRSGCRELVKTKRTLHFINVHDFNIYANITKLPSTIDNDFDFGLFKKSCIQFTKSCHMKLDSESYKVSLL